MTRWPIAALPLAMLACSSPAQGPDEEEAAREDTARPVELPEGLREISGLAIASPETVFAHNDERATIHEIEIATGRVLRSFALGDPPLEGDFEGIAAADGRIWLITSEGVLFSAQIGAHGATVDYQTRDTGVGEACEIEGLSLAPEPGALLIVCKQLHGEGRRGPVTIYRWSESAPDEARQPWLEIALDGEEVSPSGIEWDAARRRLIVIAARGQALIMLDEQGRVTGRRRLPRRAHPQPEGVAVTPSGAIVIADEGKRDEPGRLTLYPAE